MWGDLLSWQIASFGSREEKLNSRPLRWMRKAELDPLSVKHEDKFASANFCSNRARRWEQFLVFPQFFCISMRAGAMRVVIFMMQGWFTPRGALKTNGTVAAAAEEKEMMMMMRWCNYFGRGGSCGGGGAPPVGVTEWPPVSPPRRAASGGWRNSWAPAPAL